MDSSRPSKGRWVCISPGRRLVADLTALGRKNPSHGVAYDLHLPGLSKYRRGLPGGITWPVMLMKAYALAAKDFPELRRIYRHLPWPHFYEHPSSHCQFSISRQHEGEERLFFARFPNPEKYSLLDLQRKLDRFENDPVESIRQFRHQITFAKMPWPIRRLGWWFLFNGPGKLRVNNSGTFGMTMNAHGPIAGLAVVTPMTAVLGWGTPHPDDHARLTLFFDHRVMDGKLTFFFFRKFTGALQSKVIPEIEALRGSDVESKPEPEPAPDRTALSA